LSVGGTLEHVDLLLRHATTDASQGVRLGAAAAAADILTRHRLKGVSAEDANRWLATVTGVDPSVNIGLFQICGVLDSPSAMRRMMVGVRDPRADVRLGACIGLWRHCMSAKVNGNEELQQQIEGLVKDPKVRPETRAELARVCANVGYLGVRDAVLELRAVATKTVAEVLDEALRKLDTSPSHEGIWVDYGVDGGAVDKVKIRARLGVISRQQAIEVDNKVRNRALGPVRTMWLKLPGEAVAGPALQDGLRTWYAADADEVCAFGDALDLAALLRIDPVLPATAAGGRVRAVRLLKEGDIKGAAELLEQVVAMKKVPADAWWFLADALTTLGRADEARPHLETYLRKAPKKGGFVEEARKRLGPEPTA
jgi:tetratricopeptide (TPR) repeat protein